MAEKIKKTINGIVNGAKGFAGEIERFFRGKPYEPSHIGGYEFQKMDGRWMYCATNDEQEPIWLDTGIASNEPNADKKLEAFKQRIEEELHQ